MQRGECGREGIPLFGQTMQKKSPEVSHRSRETITNQLQLDWPHIKNRMRNTSVALLAQPRPLTALPCPPPTTICFWQLFQKKILKQGRTAKETTDEREDRRKRAGEEACCDGDDKNRGGTRRGRPRERRRAGGEQRAGHTTKIKYDYEMIIIIMLAFRRLPAAAAAASSQMLLPLTGTTPPPAAHAPCPMPR